MGYTHYWIFKKKVSDIENGTEKFKNAVELFKQGIEKLRDKEDLDGNKLDYKVMLGNGIGEGEPTITDDKLTFNGKCPNDYETFSITTESEDFDFCKTAHQPYDVFVCLALLCFKETFGDDISIRSDGDMKHEERWKMAHEVFNEI